MSPQKLIFQKHLEEGEEILFVAHRHWASAFGGVLEVLFFGFLLPWGLYGAGFNSPFFLKLALLWSVLAICRLIYVWIDWYADAWLATSTGVIFIQWHGFFNNSSSRVGYADIESLGYAINGFWPTVLHYGDLTLNPISGHAVTLSMAANPKKTEMTLMRCQEQFLNDRDMQDSGALKELLSKMVAHHLRSGRS